MGPLSDPNHASLLKATALGGQPSAKLLICGQTLNGTHGVGQQVQSRNQQPPQSTQEMNTEMNPRAVDLDRSLVGVHGSNQDAGSVPLKGWPLKGRMASRVQSIAESVVVSTSKLSMGMINRGRLLKNSSSRLPSSLQ